MKSTDKPKDCFGDQGGSVLGGEPPDECLTCEIFDRCHKVTMAIALQSVAGNLHFITQNGLRLGWLKSYSELDRLDPPVKEPDGGKTIH